MAEQETQKKEVLAVKVTIDERVVILREPELQDVENASLSMGNRADGNDLASSMILGKELLKRLILEVDGKQLSNLEKEQIQKHFSLKEFTMLTRVITEMAGLDSPKPQTEVVSYGG